MKLKMLFLVGLLPITCMAGCSKEPEPEKPKEPDADWTVMIYLSGNTLEDDQGSASGNLDEIAKSGKTNDKVNLVLRLGGAQSWKRAENGLVHEAGKTEDYYYSNPNGAEHGTFNLIKSQDQMLTGNPDNLLSYIKETKERYPAKKYSLWFWGHGMNSIRGLLGDTTYKDEKLDMETMTFNNMEYAIKNSGVHFEHVNFDCCLLSSVEMLSHLYEYTSYVTFSQNEIPGNGQAYNTFFPYLYSHPEMDGKAFGQKLVDFYALRYPDEDEDGKKRSFVTVDANKTPALLNSFNSFFYEYAKNLYNPDSYRTIMNLHKQEGIFQYFSSMVDINQYMNKVKETSFTNQYTDQVISSVNDMVTSKTMGEQTATCGGISYCNWINDLYQIGQYDYEYYALQDPKLYGYLAFLDSFNPGWNLDRNIYTSNNIAPLGELPFKDFILTCEYTDKDKSIASVKVNSGLKMLKDISFNSVITSKILVDMSFMKTVRTIKYPAGSIYTPVQEENIFSIKKKDPKWFALYPFYDSEDPEYQEIKYPLTMDNITGRFTDLEAGKEIFLGEMLSQDATNYYMVISYENGTFKLENLLTTTAYDYLLQTFTKEQFNKACSPLSTIDGCEITYNVKDMNDGSRNEVYKFESFDASEATLNKLFIKWDISDYLTYTYTLTDIRGYKITTGAEKYNKVH